MISTGDAQLGFTLDGRVHLTVLCNDKVISQSYFNTGDHQINFKHELGKDVTVKIIKKGATLDKITKQVHNQVLLVKNLTINGIECLEGKHGKFAVHNNPYIEDHILETNNLHLDGTWQKEILFFDFFKTVPYNHGIHHGYKFPEFKDVDIALFGASWLENGGLDLEDRWFNKVAGILNCTYQHYSAPGGSNHQILSHYNAWQKQCKSKILIFCFTGFSKLLMLINNEYKFFKFNEVKREDMKSNDIDGVSGKSYKQICDVVFWEGFETAMSLQIPILFNFFSDLEKQCKVYIMPTVFAERKFFSNTILAKWVLPPWDYRQDKKPPYPTLSDTQKYVEKLKKENIIEEMSRYL